MKAYREMSRDELLTLQSQLHAEYEEAKAKGLNLNMSRGKPAVSQLDLCKDFLDIVNSKSDLITESGVDTRNYGELIGIPEVHWVG